MKAVFCLANNENQVQDIVSKLMSSGFTSEDISILSSDKKISYRGTQEMDLSSWEKAEKVEYRPWNDNKETWNKGKNAGEIATEKHTKAPEGAATGATAGGVIGGTLGLLAGIGSLAIPGMGVFVAAGPIIAALSGSAIGGALGLLVGSLVGLGIPEYEAKKFESGLNAGKILMSCRVKTDDLEKRCKEIMEKEHATDICTTRETATSR